MQIKIDIPAERIRQLWWSAIEGGDPVTVAAKGGWCSGIDLAGVHYAIDKVPASPVDTAEWYSKDEFFGEGVTLTIKITEVDDETTGHETPHTVSNADVERGLTVMASKFPQLFGQIMEDDIDAPCADIFLQCMLFGEEKYA